MKYDGNLLIFYLIYCNTFPAPWQPVSLNTRADMGSVILFSELMSIFSYGGNFFLHVMFSAMGKTNDFFLHLL